jgi:hypothetical protein
MVAKYILYTFCGVTAFLYVTPPILKRVFRLDNKWTNEKEQERIKKWLEEKKDQPVIKNSDGENYF